MTKTSIIGQGYVGLTISVFAAQKHKVVGFDLNQIVVNQLNSGISHIEGITSQQIKSALDSKSFSATSDGTKISGSQIVVIAVPTPLDVNRKPDLTFIESACKIIAENLTSPALIINEST